MKKKPAKKQTRMKAIGLACGGVVVGIFLLWLSWYIVPPPSPAETVSTTQTATAPVKPEHPTKPRQPTDQDRRRSSAQGLSGLLFMLGLLSLGVSIISIGWLVIDIRRSRPAWMTQTKYPKRK